MFFESKNTSPESGSKNPAIMRRVVVFRAGRTEKRNEFSVAYRKAEVVKDNVVVEFD